MVLIGIIGYAYGLYGGNASLTAFIPAAFGLVLMIFGHLAVARESLRKHLMHAAVVVAFVGFVLPAGRLVSKLGDLTLSAAAVSQAVMALVCLIFVMLAVKSFADARRSG